MRNRLKSIFIGLFPVMAIAITAISVSQLLSDVTQLEWWGALLTVAPVSLMFMRLMMLKDQARTSARLPVCQFMAVAGLGLALIASKNNPEASSGLVAALVGLVSLTIYIYWYSVFGRQPSGLIKVGEKLPHFELQDEAGVSVSSDSYIGRPAIFMFYRGNWCPLCMAQIDELASLYRDLDDLHVRTVLISPQPHANTRKLAGRHNLDFDFLVDVGCAAARQLEIEMKDGLPMGMSLLGYARDTVLPTIILTDAEGTVIFADQSDNYRVRPEPQIFLRIFRENITI